MLTKTICFSVWLLSRIEDAVLPLRIAMVNCRNYVLTAACWSLVGVLDLVGVRR